MTSHCGGRSASRAVLRGHRSRWRMGLHGHWTAQYRWAAPCNVAGWDTRRREWQGRALHKAVLPAGVCWGGRGGGGGLANIRRIRREEGGKGLGPRSLCAKNGPIGFFQRYISFFTTTVTLAWRGGVQRGAPPMVASRSNVKLAGGGGGGANIHHILQLGLYCSNCRFDFVARGVRTRTCVSGGEPHERGTPAKVSLGAGSQAVLSPAASPPEGAGSWIWPLTFGKNLLCGGGGGGGLARRHGRFLCLQPAAPIGRSPLPFPSLSLDEGPPSRCSGPPFLFLHRRRVASTKPKH